MLSLYKIDWEGGKVVENSREAKILELDKDGELLKKDPVIIEAKYRRD